MERPGARDAKEGGEAESSEAQRQRTLRQEILRIQGDKGIPAAEKAKLIQVRLSFSVVSLLYYLQDASDFRFRFVLRKTEKYFYGVKSSFPVYTLYIQK